MARARANPYTATSAYLDEQIVAAYGDRALEEQILSAASTRDLKDVLTHLDREYRDIVKAELRRRQNPREHEGLRLVEGYRPSSAPVTAMVTLDDPDTGLALYDPLCAKHAHDFELAHGIETVRELDEEEADEASAETCAWCARVRRNPSRQRRLRPSQGGRFASPVGPARTGAVVYFLDDDGPYTLKEMIEANADDEELIEVLRRMRAGDEHHTGGGAQPVVVIRAQRKNPLYSSGTDKAVSGFFDLIENLGDIENSSYGNDEMESVTITADNGRVVQVWYKTEDRPGAEDDDAIFHIVPHAASGDPDYDYAEDVDDPDAAAEIVRRLLKGARENPRQRRLRPSQGGRFAGTRTGGGGTRSGPKNINEVLRYVDPHAPEAHIRDLYEAAVQAGKGLGEDGDDWYTSAEDAAQYVAYHAIEGDIPHVIHWAFFLVYDASPGFNLDIPYDVEAEYEGWKDDVNSNFPALGEALEAVLTLLFEPYAPRENPAIGKHPDLFSAEATDIHEEDWRQVPPRVLDTMVLSDFSEDDQASIEEEDPNLYSALEKRDEDAREERIKPFVEELRKAAAWRREYESEPYGYGETYIDLFQSAMAEGKFDLDDLKSALADVYSPAANLTAEEIEGVLTDPNNYVVGTREQMEAAGASSVETYESGELSDETEIRQHEGLAEAFDLLRNEGDWAEAKRELERGTDEYPSVYVDTWRARGNNEWDWLQDLFSGEDRYATLAFTTDPVDIFVWPDKDAFESALADYQAVPPPQGPGNDDVVHTFSDGFYVANLPVEAFPSESRKMGICVGHPQMPYMGRKRRGEINVYSLRTPSGRPKITIGANLDEDGNVVEITETKGKANRLPGFNAGDHDNLAHPDEVAKTVEFVESLGIDPGSISDLRPGYLAWKAQGGGSKRKNPAGAVSKKVRSLADKAYARPWGGEW